MKSLKYEKEETYIQGKKKEISARVKIWKTLYPQVYTDSVTVVSTKQHVILTDCRMGMISTYLNWPDKRSDLQFAKLQLIINRWTIKKHYIDFITCL